MSTKFYTDMVIDEYGFTVYDVASYYGISVEEVQTICLAYSIGLVTSDGVLWFEKGEKGKDSSISMFRFYYKHQDIEQKVVDSIIANQPTTISQVAKDLKISREHCWKVVDELTFKDLKLYERMVGKKFFLFYESTEE